ncbi:MAG: hypothetical protein NC201_07955 [Prevotella sp.]|nr:hypothetical protein [Bacteroides sp.]MCM1367161.1 hypothetical protein [Prevotella sp.]MCM1436269.1 hypothetical protein [Prevotella sp.]
MKRLILSFFIASVASVATHAADFNLLIHGNPVSDGQTVEIGCESEEYSSKTYYTWDPEMTISSLNGNIALNMVIQTDYEGFTCCWPYLCVELQPGDPVTFNGTISQTPSNMQFHREISRRNTDTTPMTAADAKITLEDETGSRLQFTLVCLPADSAGNNSPDVEVRREVARYDICGRRLAVPSTGINIIVYSDGTVSKTLVSKQ